jgi:hypothetical protein
MKFTKYIITILITLLLGFPGIFAQENSLNDIVNFEAEELVEGQVFEEDKVLVKYKDESEVEIIELPAPEQNEAGVQEKLEELLQDEDVEIAQPNYIYEINSWVETDTTAKPNDYIDARHWYYSKSKLPELWKDLGCPEAGDCSGRSNVVVAVLDTGVAFENFNDTLGLSGAQYTVVGDYNGINLFVNSDEVANNGLDDDCNGYVDDVNGIDAYAPYEGSITKTTCIADVPIAVDDDFRKAGHPVDTYGHGTFVTGLIASMVDNGSSSVSPAFDVSIMPLSANEYFERTFSTLALRDAVDYAIENGADILNMSFGGTGNDALFRSSLEDAYDAGVILIAASGNTSVSQSISQTTTVYPGAYDEVISIGSINSNNSLSSYSVYGAGVDMVAYVGQSGGSGGAAWQASVGCYFNSNCSSTNIDDGASTSYSIGTSFAAPQVAAAAAILKSKNSSYTRSDIYDFLINSAIDVNTAGYDIQTGYGALDFEGAFDLATANNPKPVYRFWSPQNESHFYTISSEEKTLIQTSYPSSVWTYEGVAFSAHIVNVTGAKAVYRFWSPDNQAHFFTISAAERDLIKNSYPSNVWTYEGVAYYAFSSSGSGRKPLYRFWSPDNEAHFFTTSTVERDQVINNYPDNVWTYEGIAYYVK